MNKTKNIFYIITGLYVVLSIIVIIARDNLFDRMGVLAYTNFLQVWVILGTIFLIIVLFLSQLQIRGLQNRNKILEGEVTFIKSKLYDHEHSGSEPNIIIKNPEKRIKPDQDNLEA